MGLNIKGIASPHIDGKNYGQQARATYNFAADGGAIGTINLGVRLPDNAIITRAWYDVLTTFTSASDAATIAINIGSTALNTAVAISTGTPYDAGLHDMSAKGDDFSDPSTYVKLSAESELNLVAAVEALTAGKLIVFVDYVTSD